MSQIKVFQLGQNEVVELPNQAAKLERNLQLKSSDTNSATPQPKQYKDNQQRLDSASTYLTRLYKAVCDYCESLGDDIQKKDLKQYTAFKRIKNFVILHVFTSTKR